jgi:iron complex transport system permease protein
MVLFHHDQLQSMFLWSTGTLTQTDWSVVQRLWPQLAGGVVLTLLLRPLTLMGLDDGVARNLGLALSLARLAARRWRLYQRPAGNAVGIIGFIGLFAPLLAKMLGARRLLARLLLAALIGALILWLSDQLSLAGAGVAGSLHRLGDGAYRRAAAVAAASAQSAGDGCGR